MAAKPQPRTFRYPDGTTVTVRNETDVVNVAARGGVEVQAEAPKASGSKPDSK